MFNKRKYNYIVSSGIIHWSIKYMKYLLRIL